MVRAIWYECGICNFWNLVSYPWHWSLSLYVCFKFGCVWVHISLVVFHQVSSSEFGLKCQLTVLWTICSHSKRYENQLPKELMCTFAISISEHRFNLAKWSSARAQRIVKTRVKWGRLKDSMNVKKQNVQANEKRKQNWTKMNESKRTHNTLNTSKISTEARRSQRNEKSNNKKKKSPHLRVIGICVTK